MKIEVIRINCNEIKFDTDVEVVKEWTESGDGSTLPVNSQPTLIVLDSENNIIFGDAYARILAQMDEEADVVKVSDISKIDLQKLCLTMHANGRWARYDYPWMEQNIGSELPKYGWYEFSAYNIERMIEIEMAAKQEQSCDELF